MARMTRSRSHKPPAAILEDATSERQPQHLYEASRWEIGSASSYSDGGDHEVSILMATVVADGRCCGWQPGAKASMMRMRRPQYGQGCELVAVSSVPRELPGLACGFGTASSWRARKVFRAGRLGQEAVVSNAMEALRKADIWRAGSDRRF